MDSNLQLTRNYTMRVRGFKIFKRAVTLVYFPKDCTIKPHRNISPHHSNRVKTHLHSWRLAADTSSPEEQEDNSILYSSIALPPIPSTALPTRDLNLTLACVSYSARSQQARSKLCLWIREWDVSRQQLPNYLT